MRDWLTDKLADMELGALEVMLSYVLFLWGVSIFLPNNPFLMSGTANSLRQVAPIEDWAIIAIGIGSLKIASLKLLVLKRPAFFLGASFWIVLLCLSLQAGNYGTGLLIYGSFIISNVLICWRWFLPDRKP